MPTKSPKTKPAAQTPRVRAAARGQKPAAIIPPQPELEAAPSGSRRMTRGETLIALMRQEGGATAQSLAEAVGWQVHSIRGFIAGTLKKRSDLSVSTIRRDGVTYYMVTDAAEDPS